MQIKSVLIEGTGPIEKIDLQFRHDGENRPCPMVLVGTNGSGKSILLAHIASSIIDARNQVYDDGDVEKGKVYKLRSPEYVSSGKDFSRARVEFTEGLYQSEVQLTRTKESFEERLSYCPLIEEWPLIQRESTSIYQSNFQQMNDKVKLSVNESVQLFFPPNRFEDPAWLNERNLLNVTTYSRTQQIQGISGRQFIVYSPLRANQDWLLDLIYDRFASDRTIRNVQVGGGTLPLLLETNGPASKLLKAVETFIGTFFGVAEPIGWHVGRRSQRKISITSGSRTITKNLFSLSTGQAMLLDFFLTIIRDYDQIQLGFTELADIKGVVLVDEIDLHLHSGLQFDTLPKLMALFPNVQFIVSSHSPLFVLGLERELGESRIDIIDMPSGEKISAERFGEFRSAYEFFKTSERFSHDITFIIEAAQKPVLFVEGDIDRQYLEFAAATLNRNESLSQFRVEEANGYGGLDKIWTHYNTRLANIIPQKILLLYDCDTRKKAEQKGRCFKRVMPFMTGRIAIGIENMLPDDLLSRARQYRREFIDVKGASFEIIRGIEQEVPEVWLVNKDEKRNLANWVMGNASRDDLANFDLIFDILDAVAAEP